MDGWCVFSLFFHAFPQPLFNLILAWCITSTHPCSGPRRTLPRLWSMEHGNLGRLTGPPSCNKGDTSRTFGPVTAFSLRNKRQFQSTTGCFSSSPPKKVRANSLSLRKECPGGYFCPLTPNQTNSKADHQCSRAVLINWIPTIHPPNRVFRLAARSVVRSRLKEPPRTSSLTIVAVYISDSKGLSRSLKTTIGYRYGLLRLLDGSRDFTY